MHVADLEEQALEGGELVVGDAEEADAVVGLAAGGVGVGLEGVRGDVEKGRAGVGDTSVGVEDGDTVAVGDRLVDAWETH